MILSSPADCPDFIPLIAVATSNVVRTSYSPECITSSVSPADAFTGFKRPSKYTPELFLAIGYCTVHFFHLPPFDRIKMHLNVKFFLNPKGFKDKRDHHPCRLKDLAIEKLFPRSLLI